MTKTVPQVPLAEETPDLERLVREAQARLAPPEDPRSRRACAAMRRLLPRDPENAISNALIACVLLLVLAFAMQAIAPL